MYTVARIQRRNASVLHWKNTAILRHAEFPINWISNSSKSLRISLMNSTCFWGQSFVNFFGFVHISCNKFDQFRFNDLPVLPFMKFHADSYYPTLLQNINKLVLHGVMQDTPWSYGSLCIFFVWWSSATHPSSSMLLEMSRFFLYVGSWYTASQQDDIESPSCMDWWGWPSRTYCYQW